MRYAEQLTMTIVPKITCLFLDIGGVLLTNGWDHHARKRAAANFKLKITEMEDRHYLIFDTYEEGELTLEEYLGQVKLHAANICAPQSETVCIALQKPKRSVTRPVF